MLYIHTVGLRLRSQVDRMLPTELLTSLPQSLSVVRVWVDGGPVCSQGLNVVSHYNLPFSVRSTGSPAFTQASPSCPLRARSCQLRAGLPPSKEAGSF